MKFKAIIFDMDGTIVDTSHIWNRVSLELVKRKGITCTPEFEIELRERLHGLAMDKCCAIIKDMACIDDTVDDLIKEKSRIACELYRQGITFVSGFEEFYKQLQPHNLKTSIATNADDLTLLVTKELLPIESFFGRHIYSIACVNYIAKPDPAIYLHAAQQLDIHPRECVAIEDSAAGIAAALKAGMFCIGINTGKNRDFLKNAHLIVDYYHEIDLNNLLDLKS